MSVRLRGSVQAEVYLKTQTFFSQQQLMPQGGTGEHVTSSSTSKSSNYLTQLLLSVFEDFLWVSNTFADFQVTPHECKLGCGRGNQAHGCSIICSCWHRYLGNRHNIKMFCRTGFKTFLLEFCFSWLMSLQHDLLQPSVEQTVSICQSHRCRHNFSGLNANWQHVGAGLRVGYWWANLHFPFPLCLTFVNIDFLEGERISEAQELSVSTHSCPPVQMGNTAEPRCHQHECWQHRW